MNIQWSVELLLASFLGGLVLTVFAIVLFKRKPRKLNHEYFAKQWKVLQSYCKDKNTWPQALGEADKLLDTALKRRRYKGSSMGERMVSAQQMFTDNDGVWFAHNLSKKVAADPDVRLRESEVKDALVSFRQALRDIGALQSGEAKNP